MDKDELEALLARIEARASADADAEYEGEADDALCIARSMLRVMGRRLGVGFVLEVQRDLLEYAETWSQHDNPHRRADAVEMFAVADAGYFHDIIEELVERERHGNA